MSKQEMVVNTSNMPINGCISEESHTAQSGFIDASNQNLIESTNKGDYNAQVEAAISDGRQWYRENHPKSYALHQNALGYLPGGNSRTVLYSAPFPLSMVLGQSHTVTDEDGHRFTDLVGEFSAGLYGHSEPTILSALQSAIANTGLNLGAHTRYEIEYAQLLCSRFGLEQVRFCNSGTEANLHAIMAARYFTQRKKVVVFTGAYHGGVLTFRYEPMPNTINDADFVVVEYNNIAAATAAIEQDGEIGAVLIEAMQGAAGNILGTREFLHAVQASAKKAGVVFILDEVQTSRLAPGGFQSILDLKPDLTTLGKYLGGGLAFGAFGGRKDIMAVFDPRTPTALGHSGTFNNNTLTMRAGYTGLSKVYTPEAAIAHNRRGDVLLGQLQELCRGTSMMWTGTGTLLASHFMKTRVTPIKSIADLEEDEPLKELFWLEMLKCGFWTTKRGSMAIILGTSQAELDRFLGCVGDFLRRYKPLVGYHHVDS